MEKPHPQDGLAMTAPSSPDLNDNVRAMDGSEDEGDDDVQEERNLVIDNLVEVMGDLNVE
jgi:hypothetical protein